jgi:hypothetical protein
MPDPDRFESEVEEATQQELDELAAGATHATGRLQAVVYWVGNKFATVVDTGRAVDSLGSDERDDEGDEVAVPLDLDPSEQALLVEAFTKPGPNGGAWTSEMIREWSARGGGAAWEKAQEQVRPHVEAEMEAERRRSFRVRLLHPTLTLEDRFRLPAREPKQRPREQRSRRPPGRRDRTSAAQRDGPPRPSDDPDPDPDPQPLARLRAVLRRLRGRTR